MSYQWKWALVTGASAGIGMEFAKQLAAQKANLVLVARRMDRLQALKEELSQTGVDIKTIACDLARPDAVATLFAELKGSNINIDILINNAGFGLPGNYAPSQWQDQQDFLQLMVTSYAELVHRVFPGMIERNWGRIINVASVAGLIPPSAGHTLYGPAKAFMVSFSQSLAAEGSRHNVFVSAMCPGFTLTEFHDVNKTRDKINALPKWAVMDVVPSVRGALRAMEKNHTVYVPGYQYKFLIWLARALPRPWVENLIAGQSSKIRAQ
ncbi:MAG: SDR family NAD(P)-dependent oxidoreductase [bacterium]